MSRYYFSQSQIVVNEALKLKGNILITTYTESIEQEIRKKIIEM